MGALRKVEQVLEALSVGDSPAETAFLCAGFLLAVAGMIAALAA